MTKTLYASFPDAELAEKAVGALMDFGLSAEDISLISKSTETKRREYTAHSATLAEREIPVPRYAVREDEDWRADDRILPAVDGQIDAQTAGESWRPSGPRAEWEEKFNDWDLEAKTGISTTTPGDAAAGAAKGAGIGLGAGILAALAAITVPGFGIVAGGGALATAIAGAVGATAAGAVAGGVHGYLKDQGVPEHVAAVYDETYRGGGALIAVHIPVDGPDELKAREILAKYGATNIGAYGMAA